MEREIKEETGFIVSADRQLKLRTDRSTGIIDITYTGKFIGGEFTPSEEVTEYDFYSFDNLLILLKDQAIFIHHVMNEQNKIKGHYRTASAKTTSRFE